MLRHPQITVTRIQRLVSRLSGLHYADQRPVADLVVAGPVDRISYAEAQKLEGFEPCELGRQFRPVWATFWFRAAPEVPDEWEGQRVDLLWDSQSEATLWVDGQSVQGLNMTQGDRPDAILTDRAKAGQTLAFQIEMACNNKFGAAGAQDDIISRWNLRRCSIARFDEQAWTLYHDAYVLTRLLVELDKDKHTSDKSWTGLLMSELNRFCNVIDLDDRATWEPARAILTGLYQHHNADRTFELSAIGHAHIDTAWLWPLAETHRKCERTFSTATAYMRDYPEYRFSCSQAYQYDVIARRNPDLFQRIHQYVKTGQWVPVGGTWIEPDCNIPSGESLCRQFLYGQRYFEKQFGRRCREFWNPDVFGYNGQLPQIMRLAGISRFLTQKLSWNQFNKPEHHTFSWRGIDGSEVLTHFPPADTYNAMGADKEVAEIRQNAAKFHDDDRSHEGLMLFGYGDGGGGPTKMMLEVIKRAGDLQGLPRSAMRSSDEFFERLEKDCTDLPVLWGELYFEYHRGTYTSQALVKLNNRRTEVLLHDIEFAAAAASAIGGAGYPREELDEIWKTLLLNQFHDILPGSSIPQVYADSAAQFAEAQAAGEKLRAASAEALVAAMKMNGDQFVPINTLGVGRKQLAERPDGELVYVEVPSMGVGTVGPCDDEVSVVQDGEIITLTNGHLIAKFSERGDLLSLVHRKTGRETIAAGQRGNVMEVYEDRPNAYSAWDIDPFALETRHVCPPAESCEVERLGKLRVCVKFTRKIGKQSTMTQVVELDAGSRFVRFDTHVDWQERRTMLKVAFGVNVLSMNATYEMQFGHVRRPTHYNTKFDLAKFEVPGHRWIDLGEHGFGVSMLNDCKYGFSTHGNQMRLTMLRSSIAPDPQADRGEHRFAYAIMPHAGSWQEAQVVGEAMVFNAPVMWAKGSTGGAGRSLLSVDTPSLVIDTVKRSEDGAGTVVRLYEAHGGRGVARLKVGWPIKSATLCNVLEDLGEAVEVRDGQVELAFEPFQIISVKLA